MTDTDNGCRKRWLEQERERGIKLQNARDSLRLTLMRAGNLVARGAKPSSFSPKKIKTESPSTSDNALSSQGSSISDDKENVFHGSMDTPSKKRRLTPFLATSRPNNAIASLKDSASSTSSSLDKNEVSMKNISHVVNEAMSKRVVALETKLHEAVAQNSVHMTQLKHLEARNADLLATNVALESRNATLLARVESMASSLETTLKQFASRQDDLLKEQTESLRAKYEAQISDLAARLTSVTSKFDAIREDVDLKCNDRAGDDIMPLVDELEEQLVHDEDEDLLEEARSVMLPALKTRIREYAVWVKIHDEERQLLRFSNQVYLQQINELQQKNLALHKEVAAAQQRVVYIEQNAAVERQELMNECEQTTNKFVSALEKAVEKNKQLHRELAAAKEHAALQREN